jgi:NTP pyrophosphatase (non-canonical NTP hydrolase)
VDQVNQAVKTSVRWLDSHHGNDRQQQTLRILKVTEEAGEVAQAWIGYIGQNPRKGITHTDREVADELADVALTALVAIESLGFDAHEVLTTCATKVLKRLDL